MSYDRQLIPFVHEPQAILLRSASDAIRKGISAVTDASNAITRRNLYHLSADRPCNVPNTTLLRFERRLEISLKRCLHSVPILPNARGDE